MEFSRKTTFGRNLEGGMSALALRTKEALDEAIYAVVDALPAKHVARAVGITERNVRALKYREHEPSHETAVRFGFAYPSVGNVYAYWAQRMTQADFFEPETQSAFWRDYNRAGKSP